MDKKDLDYILAINLELIECKLSMSEKTDKLKSILTNKITDLIKESEKSIDLDNLTFRFVDR